MAAESPSEAMLRKAKEQQAANAAAEAQKKADEAAGVDPKVAADKARQEAEEAAADLVARQQAAVEMAAKNQASGVPGVTSNAGGNPAPVTAIPAAQTQELVLDPVMPTNGEVGMIERPWRTFQHLYANANTILPNGKKIIFGGPNGHIGQYSTNVPEQIQHLAELANTPGSMITEVRKDAEGRYIVVTDSILEAEKQAALVDSRMNTARQQDPNVSQAMNNLGRTIAQDS
jgi:hypothetical protein